MNNTIFLKLNKKVFNEILNAGIDIKKFVLAPVCEDKKQKKTTKKDEIITWDDLNEETKKAIIDCENNKNKRKSYKSFKELLKDCDI